MGASEKHLHDISRLQARTRFAEGHVIVVLAFLTGLPKKRHTTLA